MPRRWCQSHSIDDIICQWWYQYRYLPPSWCCEEEVFFKMCLWMGCRHGQIGDSCIILKKVFWLVNVLHKSILWHSKQRLFSALNWYDGIKTSQYGVDDDDKDKIRDRSSAAKRESRQPLLVIDVNMWQDEQHTWCLLLMSIYLLSQYTPFDICTYLLMPIYFFGWRCVTRWALH